MASGGWFAGLLYDHFGYYATAFAAGLIFNAVNLVLIGALVWRRCEPGRTAARDGVGWSAWQRASERYAASRPTRSRRRP